MNKRDAVARVFDPAQAPAYVPAAFFLHFDADHQRGRPAVEKHLEFFNATGMDFVKIQYEHHFPHNPDIQRPEDWSKMPVYPADFFTEPLRIIEGLVKAVKKDAFIVQTLYSPFMIAGQVASSALVVEHIRQNPAAFKRGIQAITESLANFVREAIRLGIDGFYASTQGGEANRFEGATEHESRSLFEECIKPYDLMLMNEANRGTIFNILHVCDYALKYDDLTRFIDYPGQVVNSNLEMAGGRITAREVEALFHRPFMGGLDRLGVLATGTPEQIRAEAERALSEAPERYILAADCTVPGSTPWENLKIAIDTAHAYRQ